MRPSHVTAVLHAESVRIPDGTAACALISGPRPPPNAPHPGGGEAPALCTEEGAADGEFGAGAHLATASVCINALSPPGAFIMTDAFAILLSKEPGAAPPPTTWR